MAENADVQVITIGGKDSLLSTASLYAIATRNARVRIDTSAFDRLTDRPITSTPLKTLQNPFLDCHNSFELRACLAVLLYKFLHDSNPSGVRTFLVEFLAEKLNSFDLSYFCMRLDNVVVNDVECALIEKSAAELYGIFAVLLHGVERILAAVDCAAALSCEAVNVNVSVLDSVDTGDWYVCMDRVANGMKFLLTGYKGEVESESIWEILIVNGNLRQVCEALFFMSLNVLNSGVEVLKNGAAKVVGSTVYQVVCALRHLGESSLNRAKMNLEVVGDANLRSVIVGMFEKEIGKGDELKKALKLLSDSLLEEKYGELVHGAYGYMDVVLNIVVCEWISAFFALSGRDVMNPVGVKGEMKGDKRNKKTVLGKGTSVIVQFMKGSFLWEGNDSRELMRWVQYIQSFFDPRTEKFNELVIRFKDIVETNESSSQGLTDNDQ